MSAFPMPGMPSIPSISAGGGGPSSAKNGNNGSNGGYDGSNWAVNFGGQNGVGTSVPTPQAVGYMAGSFGLPSYVSAPIGSTTPSGLVLTPTVLAVGVVALVLLLRHRG